MKKLHKLLVAIVMAFTTFAFVGCGNAPAWQQIDTINTKASYQSVEYSEMTKAINDVSNNTTEEQEKVLTKVKLSSTVKSKGMDVKISGVFDTDETAKNLIAIKYHMIANSEMLGMPVEMGSVTIDGCIYITSEDVPATTETEATKVQYAYVDLTMTVAGETQTIKLKSELNASEEENPFAMFYEMAIESFTEMMNVKNIKTYFTINEAEADNFNFEVANENDVTKYRLTLKDAKTSVMEKETIKNLESYVAIKNNQVLESYISVVTLDADNAEFNASFSMKGYNDEVPQPNGTYKTVKEIIAEEMV